MRPRSAATLLVVALALVACGSGGTEGQVGAPAASDVGLLAFEAATVSGETVDVSGFAGRDLVIWFWAPW